MPCLWEIKQEFNRKWLPGKYYTSSESRNIIVWIGKEDGFYNFDIGFFFS